MATVEIELIACRSDNYAVVVRASDGTTVLVDAPETAPIAARLAARGWQLSHILITHHHGDHVEALADLKAAHGAEVIGPAADAHRIAGLDRLVKGGDEIAVGSLAVEVIDTPGHTVGHVAYHLPAEKLLFSGDTLFALGCGRLFEGTAAQMWGSLSALAALPDDTAVYCGHEYTLSNARFALGIEPGNAALVARAGEIEALRAAGTPTIPSTIGLEKATNPFLRAGEASVAVGIGLQGAPAADVFAEVRRRKDRA